MLRTVRAVAWLSVVAGCRPPVDTGRLIPVPVSGVVLMHKKPLGGATVSFLSLDGRVSCRGETNDRGEFTLSTYDPGDGAPAGKYRVLVSIDAFEVSRAGRRVPKPQTYTGPPVPVRYTKPSASPLTAEVTSSGPNRFAFGLE